MFTREKNQAMSDMVKNIKARDVQIAELKSEVERLKAGLRECIAIAESYNKRDGRLDAIEELI
jgi:hypothetical protein